MGYYVDKELYHHGIKGQRWGIRRFQNYDGTRIRKGSEPATSPVAKKGLTDEQKKALKIAAGVTAGLLVAYGGYKLATSPKAKALATNVLYGNKDKRLADLDKEIANMGPEIVKRDFTDKYGGLDLDTLPKIDKSYLDMDNVERAQAIADLNPMGGSKNCQACTAAYDIMRRFGVKIGIRPDVDTLLYKSSSFDGTGANNAFMSKIYKDFKDFKRVMPADNCVEIGEQLKRLCGDGDEVYGRMNLVKNTGGSMHAVTFYMSNGKARIIDSESRRDFSLEQFDRYVGDMINWDLTTYLRTDNLELADGALEFLYDLSTKEIG